MQTTKLDPNVVSFNAGISACEKGKQWQRALALMSEMRETKLEPDAISYNAGISACERCGHWRQALSLFGEMFESSLEPDELFYNLVITVCERTSGDFAGFPDSCQIGLSRFRAFYDALCVCDHERQPL
ncbi:unnamed protein product [Prorocentrum cordatum]|uniref:Pentatricopeptide repeat-containing protein n=1 Tax=Prorocentrum cordatum TaxID=2364126 RepID=A0ABN9TNX0_9DINO|nr:unnamed protein product [Polarella glacialis]